MAANVKYWKKRRDELLKSLEKDEAKLSQKMSKHYARELKQLEKDIAYYYSKYGAENVIEYRRLLQTLSFEDARMLIERCEDFAKKYPQYSHLIPVRESIYKLNRLEGLQQSMYLQQLKLGAIEQDVFTAHLLKTAARGYKAVSGLGTTAINDDALKKLINMKWHAGKNFSDRIWDNKAKLSQFLQTDFKDGIIRGDGYDKMIKQLTQRLGVGKSDAQRLVVTEGTYILNESSMSAFEDWHEQYKYSAIGDSHTCSICSSMHGQIFSIKDREPGTNFPPMHANCRCSFEIVIKDEADGMTKHDMRMDATTGDLTDDEIGAINRYISSESYILNAKLREQIPLSADEQKLKRNLDYAIVKLPKYRGLVYRSLDSSMIEDLDRFNLEHTPGMPIRYDAYTSASLSVYDNTFDIQFIINSKSGADITKYNKSEQEILFKRGSMFVVDRREGNKIWLTEI